MRGNEFNAANIHVPAEMKWGNYEYKLSHKNFTNYIIIRVRAGL